ncbi:hypothetical protein yc1106_03563 [Curvularia clavata]|uniref:Heterokaryon incompatibility domain-containing protein n=1 Tax=Curvularia clavata TaxID=95742 RepID=A0A9Q8Z5C2_CURCL|nr:hypothetical protein yc1106_03563 [Curvularia clavata]
MRLLQIQSGGKFSLVERVGNDIPQYAILSHTWGPSSEEVSFQDLQNGTGESKKGYRKLVFCSKEAARNGLEYFWVDTCCIDKTSSAELSEAINSMYRWYQEASVCYAYLADVPSERPFPRSRWFTRGWTLQELIAPPEMVFFDESWESLGERRTLFKVISECTGISTNVLLDRNHLDTCSVAQKMSWAAKRETTRIEDQAYCMLGIFEINMPLIYGEGENAFIRLQEEIMKVTDDHSLFAWRSSDNRGGCLATSPASFLDSSNVVQSNFSGTYYDPPVVSSRGIHLELRFVGSGFGGLGFAILNCCEKGRDNEPIAIHVRDTDLTMRRFERIQCGAYAQIDLRTLDPSQCPMRRLCICKGRTTRRKDQSEVQDDTYSAHIDLQTLSKGSIRMNPIEALFAAARTGTKEEVWLLLTREDVDINSKDFEGQTILSCAAQAGNEEVFSMLLRRMDGQVNASDKLGRTALIWASMHGYEAMVKLLLNTSKVDVNVKDEKGRTPVSWAAENGHEIVAKLLLGTNKVSVDTKDETGRTPLSWAAGNGHVAVAKLLLSTRKVDVNTKDREGRAPVVLAATHEHTAMVKLLLSTGEVDVDIKTEKGRPLLVWAAIYGHKTLVRLLLSTNKVSVDVKDETGRTPLSWAAGNGHVAVAKLLLSTSKAEVNTTDCDGRTPLSWAAAGGHEAIVKLLLSTDRIIDNAVDKHRRTPILWAAANGYEAVVESLLSTSKDDFNTTDCDGRTPLYWAVRNGHEAVVKLILTTSKEDVNTTDCDGRTPLSWAAGNGHDAVTKLLLDISKADVNITDCYGRTPLSWAAARGHEATVELLLSRPDIRINLVDKHGHTPLSWTVVNGHAAVFALLDSTEKTKVKRRNRWWS